MPFNSLSLPLCPSVFLASAAAISSGVMALLVKKMIQVEINIFLLSDYILFCLVAGEAFGLKIWGKSRGKGQDTSFGNGLCLCQLKLIVDHNLT